MRVATKLAIGYGLLVLLLAGVVVYHLGAVRGLQDTNRTLASLVLRLAATTADQLGRLEELSENANKYWITRDPGYVARFEETRAGFAAGLDELAALELAAEERESVERLSALWPELFPADSDLDELIAAHTVPAGPRTLADGGFDVWLDDAVGQLRAGTAALYRASERAMAAEMAASLAAAQRVERISFTALAAALSLSVLVFIVTLRSITGPLAQLQRGTRAVAAGDFGYRLVRSREDEFAELAADFNRMTEQLRELDRAKRDFVSQVSHDLKTPLAAIEDANLLLLDEIPGRLNERQRRLLDHNVNSGRRLAGMLGKLLDVSRMEAGAVGYVFERVDLHAVIRQAVGVFESAAERRGLTLEVELPEPSLTAECDAERVLQVIENLIENAVRYSPEGGTIRVGARTYSASDPRTSSSAESGGGSGGGFALVSVADSGPGVPDGEKTHVFERFHQSPGGSGRGGGGVGLGLAICEEIVRAHGGRIWVSDAPEGGALFTFLLPLAAPARRPAPVGAVSA